MKTYVSYRLLDQTWGAIKGDVNESYRHIMRLTPKQDREFIGENMIFIEVVLHEDETDKEVGEPHCISLNILDTCYPDYFAGTSEKYIAIPLQRFTSARDFARTIESEIDNILH